MDADFKFEVGSKYKNMKGEYEVISLQREEMVIRWTDGREITTTTDVQKRIIERIAHENRMEMEAQSQEKKKKKK